jgi:hypothetical protein
MVVPPPFADLRHPADRWQTVFVRMMPLAKKSVQKADRCDIQATVSRQADESRRSGASFSQHHAMKKSAAQLFGWLSGTLSGGCDATRAPTRYRATALPYSTSGKIADLPGHAAPAGRYAHWTELTDRIERQG